MIKSRALLFFLAAIGTACHNNPSFTDPKATYYWERSKETAFPLIVSHCGTHTDTQFEQNDPLVNETGEPYRKFEGPGEKYYAVLTLVPTYCYVPLLMTYDKNGNKVDQMHFYLEHAGNGHGYEAREYLILEKDLNLLLIDTVITQDLDSLENEIPGTEKITVFFKKGKISSEGKILLDQKETKKELK